MVHRMRVVLNYRKLSLGLLLGSVLYNEFFVYFYSCWGWPKSYAGKVPILFVADPQIQGYADEPGFLLGTITRWDSDRYLSKGFRWATWAYNPQVVVFLGDLMDEASLTTENHIYETYVRRFYSIYPSNSASTMVYLPGDNDVGGEGSDPLTPEKIAMFRKYFPGNSSVIDISKYIQIFTIPPTIYEEGITYTNPPRKEVKNNDKAFRIILSHKPILPQRTSLTDQVLSILEPSVIISAHNHRGMIYKISSRNNKSDKPYYEAHNFFSDNGASVSTKWNAKNDAEECVREINVPTCSYRMGVEEMAFGLLLVNEATGEIEYYNLWLPQRFPALYGYAFSFLAIAFLLLLSKCKQKRSNKRSIYYKHY